MEVTRELILSLFTYDRENGRFFHNRRIRKVKPFSEAGDTDKNGYRRISINGKKMFLHRAIWLVEYGELPPEGFEIDHIDRVRSNNRITNLRLANRAENKRNQSLRSISKSGVTGVTWNKAQRTWIAMITKDRKQIYLGKFDDFNDAVATRLDAEKKYFGRFAPIGKEIPLNTQPQEPRA